ncbi:hypothetical protein R1sor_022583 [Riccia sorocarpa]|uniref:Uncharacterized protein n=1 Tax=Riccia sorocarpa TaxID=122646 RepID=A0ABD3GN93_9MARC
MCGHDLVDPVVKQKVREAWDNETEVVRDSRRRWAQGWCRVKRVLREARSAQELQKKTEGDLEAEIEWRKARLDENQTDEEVDALERVEKHAKDRALQEAREWRTRSRVKWLSEDEEPSKFFFSKLKAKWARESIECLETNDGELLMEGDEILAEIHEFYLDLYTAEPEMMERTRAREDVLSLVETGPEVKESVGIDNAVKRIQHRIVQWDSSYLPWAARSCAFKARLSQIPTYTIMAAGCSKKEGKKLERFCSQFFWGITSEGKVRKPLIAWKRLIRPEQQGGLGLLSFESRAATLQMRYISDLLDGKELEWMWIAERMLRIKLITGPSKLERLHWDAGTALLLLKMWRIPEAPTLDRLCKSWFQLKQKLRLSNPKSLPAGLPIVSLKLIWQVMTFGEEGAFKQLEQGAKTHKLILLKDICSSDGWVDRDKIDGFLSNESARMTSWLNSILSKDVSLQSTKGWVWEGGRAVVGEHFRISWNEWNMFVFEQVVRLQLPRQVILSAELNCKASWRRISGDQSISVRQKDEEFLVRARQVEQEILSRQVRINDILREAAGFEIMERVAGLHDDSTDQSNNTSAQSNSQDSAEDDSDNNLSSEYEEGDD